MSGHSKWANIKNRKGAQDKKRSESFTKVAKNIITAIRAGGGNINPESNSILRTAIEKAREVNMPKDNIDRLLTSFEERKANSAAYVFEGYGPYGVPVVVEAESDNKNRTIGEIKSIFKKYDGNLGESGSVMYQFDKKGAVELKDIPEDLVLEVIDAGALDIDGTTVYTEPEAMANFVKKLETLGLKVTDQTVVLKAKMPLMLQNEDEVVKMLDLVEDLEENDDVISVYTGFDYNKTNTV